MFVLTKHPEKYRELAEQGVEIVDATVPFVTATRLEEDGIGLSFRRLYGIGSGPALVLGMGPSRTRMPECVKVPVFGINRAARDFTVDYWVSHDHDALSIHASVPSKVPLITTVSNHRRARFQDEVAPSGRTVYFYDTYDDPSAHAKRPLYWNATTLAIAIDLAFRMGYEPVFTLGTDLTEGGYVNETMTDEALRLNHRELRRKIELMFTPSELKRWNPEGRRVIDLSGGNMPCEKWPLEKALPCLRGEAA